MSPKFLGLLVIFLGVARKGVRVPTELQRVQAWGKTDHTSFVLGITCIRDNEVVCPESSAILCIGGANFRGDSLKTKKRCGPEKHTSFVLGITCIRDKEVVCPESTAILCIKGASFKGVPFNLKNDAVQENTHPPY